MATANIPQMQQLIPVISENTSDGIVQTVNARDLHNSLEVGKDFSNWIKDRIEKYNFVVNQDFVCSPVLAREGRGGQNRIEYHISLDMAKEISMVERNEKGKEARQYFIQCEKQLRGQALPAPLPAEEYALSLAPKAVMAAQSFGFDGNAAFLSADNAIRRITGVSALKLLGKELVAEKQEQVFNPTDIEKMLGLGKNTANPLLTDAGLQTAHRGPDKNGRKGKLYYELTEECHKYAYYVDTGKAHHSGAPVK